MSRSMPVAVPIEVDSHPDQFSVWMKEAQSGNAASYEELLNALRIVLGGYFARALSKIGKRDPAVIDDLTQETLLAVHEKRHTYEPARPVLPWFFAIARYKWLDHLRREGKRRFNLDIHALEEVLAAPVFEGPGAESDLETLLLRLTPKAEATLRLVKIQGLSVAEAAAITQMSESAVKVTVHRAIQKLGLFVNKEEKESRKK